MPWATDRGRGYVDTVGRAGHRVDVFRQAWSLMAIPPDTAANAPDVRLVDWLAVRPKPLALLVCNDVRGREVVQACQDGGLPVPDEVAVLGVDDDDLSCALSNPPLSSVAVQWQRMGYRAAELLHRSMAGEPVPILVPPTGIVERASTGTVAVDDAEVRRAVQFIRANAHRRLRADDVVQAVGTMTRRSLERRFRALLDRTPQDEIRQAHFARAKLPLSGTDMPMDQVAAASGFPDPEWFAKAFRDTFGEPPDDYRRRNGDGPVTPG